MNGVPRLVAHRGLMARYPENTLRGLEEALAAGARYLEFDVQLTTDGVPVLFHDDTLRRTTGQAGSILDLTAAEAGALPAYEPARLGQSFAGERVPRLGEAVALLNHHAYATAFVEIKRHSLARHGLVAVDRTVQTLRSARFPWVMISFVKKAIEHARDGHGATIGWVLRRYDVRARDQAERLSPAFLFCNWSRLSDPDTRLWSGPWEWVVYDVMEPDLARRLQQAGADLIETADVDALARALADG